MKIYLQAGAFAAALMVMIGFFAYMYLTESNPSPCAPGGTAIKCYHASNKVCEKVWTTSEAACKEWLDNLKLPAGRLTGPIMRYCQEVHLDNAFGATRKSSQECMDHFRDLEEWRRQNMPEQTR